MSNDQKTRVALPPECMALPSTEELRALWRAALKAVRAVSHQLMIKEEARRRTAKA
jgi:hypothetical protein